MSMMGPRGTVRVPITETDVVTYGQFLIPTASSSGSWKADDSDEQAGQGPSAGDSAQATEKPARRYTPAWPTAKLPSPNPSRSAAHGCTGRTRWART